MKKKSFLSKKSLFLASLALANSMQTAQSRSKDFFEDIQDEFSHAFDDAWSMESPSSSRNERKLRKLKGNLDYAERAREAIKLQQDRLNQRQRSLDDDIKSLQEEIAWLEKELVEPKKQIPSTAFSTSLPMHQNFFFDVSGPEERTEGQLKIFEYRIKLQGFNPDEVIISVDKKSNMLMFKATHEEQRESSDPTMRTASSSKMMYSLNRVLPTGIKATDKFETKKIDDNTMTVTYQIPLQ